MARNGTKDRLLGVDCTSSTGPGSFVAVSFSDRGFVTVRSPEETWPLAIAAIRSSPQNGFSRLDVPLSDVPTRILGVVQHVEGADVAVVPRRRPVLYHHVEPSIVERLFIEVILVTDTAGEIAIAAEVAG